MDYPIGCDRCLIIILLVAYISRVADGRVAMPQDAKQDFAVNGSDGGGGGGGGGVDRQPPDQIGSLGRDTVNAAHRMLRGLGRFLLSAGQTINSVWDAALNAALGLLRAGGAAYRAVAAKVARVPVVGYAAGGVAEAIRVTVAAAESTARHDMHARRDAFAALAARLDEGKGGAKAPPATAEVFKGAVHFPDR